jgi:DNA polymerase-1
MRAERLDTMLQTAIGYDRETYLIQPGLLAPPPVLGSASEYNQHHAYYMRLKREGVSDEDMAAIFGGGVPSAATGVLLDNEGALALFQQILDTPSAVVCVANGAFDFLVDAVELAKRGVDVMPKIFAMYDPAGEIVRGDCDGRVFEIQLAEGLHAIAQGHLGKHALTGQQLLNKATGRPGRYSLDNVTHEVLGREDAKVNDRFRMSYAQFRGWPLSALPFEAQTYPVDDTNNTLEDALAQAGHLPSVNHHEWVSVHKDLMQCRHCGAAMRPDTPQACMRKQRRRNLHALAPQAYFAWAAHCGSAWGLHVPQDAVDDLEARVDAQRESSVAPFKAAGLIREDGTEDQSVLKRLVAVAYGARDLCPACNGEGKVPSEKTNGRTKVNCKACDGTKLLLPPEVPRSEGGGVGKSRDVLIESGDSFLMDFGEQPSKKIKTTYIPLLRRGRACNVCGGTGASTKYKKGHEDWCTAQSGEAGYRPIPLIVRTDPLKETLRAAIEDGLHSMPRTGGVRECFVARDGYVYSSEDYAAGELVTLADACLRVVGWSKMADALNAGLDPHLALAGTANNKTYEQMLAAKKAKEPWLDPQRQVYKKTNFGMGGGMAELEFVLKPCRADPASFTPCANGPSERNGVRGFNGTRPCIMMDGEDFCGRPGEKVLVWNDKPTGSPVCVRCLRCGKRAREMFFTQWPEVKELHNHTKKLIRDVGPSSTAEIAYPDLITRGGLGFCDGANGWFQMRLAKAAKAAFCQVQRECMDRTWRVRSSEMMASPYDGHESPLWGSRAILLFHDEIVAEHPASVASDAAKRVSEIMVETLRFACPPMYKACKAEPTLMRKLYKGAEPVWENGVVGGNLLVWEPKQ